jgi:hypothetical protein
MNIHICMYICIEICIYIQVKIIQAGAIRPIMALAPDAKYIYIHIYVYTYITCKKNYMYIYIYVYIYIYIQVKIIQAGAIRPIIALALDATAQIEGRYIHTYNKSIQSM